MQREQDPVLIPAIMASAICPCGRRLEIVSPLIGSNPSLTPEGIKLTRFAIRIAARSLGWAVFDNACVCKACVRSGVDVRRGAEVIWHFPLAEGSA